MNDGDHRRGGEEAAARKKQSTMAVASKNTHTLWI